MSGTIPTPTLIPFREWLRQLSLGHNGGYAVLARGEVDTLLVNARRYVVAASSDAFIERQLRGKERSPEERAAAAAAYRASVVRQRLPAARRGDVLKHGTERKVSAQPIARASEKPSARKRVSPPPPKTKPSKRLREETSTPM
jgi:hypothetical protein